MTDLNVKFKVDSSEANSSMRSLMQEMSKLKGQLGNNLLSPQDKNVIALRMGEIKGELADMKYAIANIDPGDTFGNVATAMRPVVAGFGALTSAAVLFGGENKKMQELQTKIMATIQITQALQEVADTKRIKALYTMYANDLKNLFIKKSTTVAIQAETVATEGAVVAQEGLNVAMSQNPFGAIIALISGLVVAYQLVSSALGNDTVKTEDNNKIKERNLELIGKIKEAQLSMEDKINIATINRLVNEKKLTKTQADQQLLRMELNKEEKKIQDELNDITDKTDKKTRQHIALYDAGKLTYYDLQESERELIDQRSKLQTKLDSLIKTNDAYFGIQSKNIELNNKETKSIKEKTIQKENNYKLTNKEIELLKPVIGNYTQLQNKLSELNNTYNEQLLNKDSNADKTQAEIIYIENLIKGIDDLKKKRNELKEEPLTGDEIIPVFDPAEAQKLLPKRTATEQLSFLTGIDTKELKTALDDLKNMTIDTLGQIATASISQNFSEQIDEMKSKADENYNSELKRLDDLKSKKLITDEDYTKRKEALDKKQEKITRDIRKKEWELNRQEALANIVINTAVGAAKAIGQTGVGATFAIPLIIAAGAAQTAQVLAQKPPKYKKGGTLLQGPSHENGGILLPGFGEVEGGEFITSRINTQNQLPTLQALNGNNDLITNLIAETRLTNELLKRPNRSYVVESDITLSQQRIRRIEANASI